MIFLKTERLVLRNVAQSDAHIMYDYRNNETCARYQRGQTKDLQGIEAKNIPSGGRGLVFQTGTSALFSRNCGFERFLHGGRREMWRNWGEDTAFREIFVKTNRNGLIPCVVLCNILVDKFDSQEYNCQQSKGGNWK